jgi:thiamine biosynthesis lipoprotein
VQSVTIVVDGPNAGVRSDVLTKPLFISGAQWLTMAQRLQLPSVLRVAEDGTVSATANLADRLKFQPHDGKLPDIRRISP